MTRPDELRAIIDSALNSPGHTIRLVEVEPETEDTTPPRAAWRTYRHTGRLTLTITLDPTGDHPASQPVRRLRLPFRSGRRPGLIRRRSGRYKRGGVT